MNEHQILHKSNGETGTIPLSPGSFRVHEPVDSAPGAVFESINDRWNLAQSTPVQPNQFLQPSNVTIGSFIEHKFVREHIAIQGSSGKAFYQAMLKHVIMPEEVDRIFQCNLLDPRRKLRARPGWPYMDNIRLREARPDDVFRLTAAALMSGYSVNTAKHIRNVVGAIFSYAIREKFLCGENPVNFVKPPQRKREHTRELTPEQASQALNLMEYPEREMTLFGIFTGMSPAEIAGLQWGQINLTDKELDENGDRIPPRTIAVRKRWYRSKLERVKASCARNIPIHDRLLGILIELGVRSRFAGHDSFVLVSRAGTPLNQDNVMARRLRPMARKLGVSSLSWQTFRRNYAVLASEGAKS